MICPFCRNREATREIRIDAVRRRDDNSHLVMIRCDECARALLSYARKRGDAAQENRFQGGPG
jgi:hypothetical protein